MVGFIRLIGVGEFAETAYWVLSRLAAKQANTVPLPKCVDPFRYIPFRALGHGSAIGEIVRDHYSDDVNDILNDVASGYMVFHAIYQAFCAGGGRLSVSAFFDSLIFDGFASAIIPCFICYHVSRITGAVLREISAVPPMMSKWGPIVVGLVVLLLSHEFIDKCVDQAMDETLRAMY